MKSDKEKFGGQFTDEIEKKNKEINRPVKILSWIFGVAGLFIFGRGMSFSFVNDSDTFSLILGSIVGIAGMAMIIANKFIYDALVAKRKYRQEMNEVSAELKGDKEDNGE